MKSDKTGDNFLRSDQSARKTDGPPKKSDESFVSSFQANHSKNADVGLRRSLLSRSTKAETKTNKQKTLLRFSTFVVDRHI